MLCALRINKKWYPKTQKVNLIANCTCLGSPTPCRRNPLKSNRLGAVREFWFPQVESALIRLSVLKVLNISTVGVSARPSPILNGRDSRQSNEKYSLSFRNVFRLAHGGGTNAPGFAGCAERTCTRGTNSNPHGSCEYI